MNTKHPLYQALAAPLSRVWLAARQGLGSSASNSLQILNFHETPKHTYPIFTQLVTRLRREHRFVFITPQEAESLLNREDAALPTHGRTPCLLTFDDGFRSNYFLAREVLEPLDIRALFFVCPGLVDLEPEPQKKAIACNIRLDPFAVGDAKLEHELMTWKEIQILASSGHEIGSHGLSHRRLSEASQRELETEVGKAANELAARLGRPARWLAYPFGSVESINAPALASVAEHHRFCRSGVRGINAPGTPALGLLSQTIDPCDPVDYQLTIATGALDVRYRAARKELSAIIRMHKQPQKTC